MFRKGHPPARLLKPVSDMLEQAAHQRLGDKGDQGVEDLLQYGPDLGSDRFRKAVAGFLNANYAKVAQDVDGEPVKVHPVTDDCIVATSGSSMAFDWICSRYCVPGDVVLMESPTYFLAQKTVLDHHLRPVGVPLPSPDSSDDFVESVKRVLDSLDKAPKLFYTIPTFHNPTGRTMDTVERVALLKLCHERHLLLVSDDVYDMLYFDDQPAPPNITTLDQWGTSLSIGTFSKLLAPALRVGWIACSSSTFADELLGPLTTSGFLSSGGGPSHFTADLVATVLEGHAISEQLLLIRKEYAHLRDVLCATLRAAVPAEELDIFVPGGGYFVWCRLKNTTGTAVKARLPPNVTILAGEECSILNCDVDLKPFIRLSFAYQTEDSIREGVAVLAASILSKD